MKNARNSSGRWANTLKTFGKKPPLKKESRHVVSVVTQTKATQKKFWDKFWNQPMTMTMSGFAASKASGKKNWSNLQQPLIPFHGTVSGSESPGAPLTYFNDGGVRQRFIFYTQKNPNFSICLPKKIPTFFSIPKKTPQCFCISKFYYLSSGKRVVKGGTKSQFPA